MLARKSANSISIIVTTCIFTNKVKLEIELPCVTVKQGARIYFAAPGPGLALGGPGFGRPGEHSAPKGKRFGRL